MGEPAEVILDCTDPTGRDTAVARAAEVVRAGRIVVLPTDTVYGVGADAFDVVAVAMVLAAKHRGREMPPPVLVPSARTVDGLAAAIPMYAQILMRQFWPGALTVVLQAQPSLVWDLGEANGTVAVRMPDDEVALALLGEVGPMAVTSANVTGSPAATTAQEAFEQLGGAVTAYLDGGPRTGGEPSTIVDCTGAEPVVLRHGAIGADRLRGVLGQTVLHDSPEAREDAERAEDDEERADDEAAGAPDDAAGAPEDDGPRLVGSVRPSRVPTPASALRTLPGPDRPTAP